MNIKSINKIVAVLLLVFTMTIISPSTINVKASDTYITPLIAGQYMTIGYVETWLEDISETLILHVKYVINDTSWYLTEVHLALNTSLAGIPRTRTGNPIPGQFEYKVNFTSITTFYEAYIPLDSSEQAASQLYVAIHANVDTIVCTTS